MGGTTFVGELEDFYREMDRDINSLMSIRERLKLIPVNLPSMSTELLAQQKGATITNNVFIVHGHDKSAKDEVARLIDKLHLIPVILHEQPDKGRTIIEKFENHAEDATYAVILLTPDDIGGENQENLRSRACQNVILELGYFSES